MSAPDIHTLLGEENTGRPLTYYITHDARERILAAPIPDLANSIPRKSPTFIYEASLDQDGRPQFLPSDSIHWTHEPEEPW